MSAVTASLCSTLLFFSLFVFVSADPETITAEPGQNVTLPCQAPNNNITVVKWSRADLKEEEYVLLYRDGHIDPENQHLSFKNRVDLQDRQMKNGNVSLILKNVTTADNGTYECHVQKDGDSLKLISIIYLSVVDPPGQKTISAKPGQKNATLPCQVPNNNITAVEWSRADLKPENVLVYQDGHFDSDKQHPSFKNRVELLDRQMKDGDVSLILKDVTINDTGTYECRVNMSGGNTDPICIIYLSVVDPPGQTGGDTGKKSGHGGLIVGLIVVVFVVIAVVIVVVVNCRERK
ncbi:unnamed protein product [Oreochromis niloticus]|nr:unnamed protein product [Mustela putorius furo]